MAKSGRLERPVSERGEVSACFLREWAGVLARHAPLECHPCEGRGPGAICDLSFFICHLKTAARGAFVIPAKAGIQGRFVICHFPFSIWPPWRQAPSVAPMNRPRCAVHLSFLRKQESRGFAPVSLIHPSPTSHFVAFARCSAPGLLTWTLGHNAGVNGRRREAWMNTLLCSSRVP